jgi:putative phage-type endonuclease
VVTAVLPYELIAQHVPLSPEWHATRTLGLGGSEIAAVLGLSKYESAFSLWHRKAGGIIPESDNPAMEWGRRLEGVVAAKFAENHPDLALVNTPGTYRNRERTWQIANPDGVLFDDDRPFPLAPVAIYEGKTARYDYEWGTPGTDEIPVPYLVQVRWYMDVFGVDTCHLAVLIGGSDYREYVIHPDADDTALMQSAGAAFMRSLDEGVPPSLDGSDATYQAVRVLHPDIELRDVEIDEELASDYLTACDNLTDAEAAKRFYASTVLDAMGTARRATVDGKPFAIRMARGNSAPFLKLCKEYTA